MAISISFIFFPPYLSFNRNFMYLNIPFIYIITIFDFIEKHIFFRFPQNIIFCYGNINSYTKILYLSYLFSIKNYISKIKNMLFKHWNIILVFLIGYPISVLVSIRKSIIFLINHIFSNIQVFILYFKDIFNSINTISCYFSKS